MLSSGTNGLPTSVRRGSHLVAVCAVLSAVGAAAAVAAIRHLDSATPAYLELAAGDFYAFPHQQGTGGLWTFAPKSEPT